MSSVKRPQDEGYSQDNMFIIAEWDRATRSVLDGVKIIERIADRGAVVKVLDMPFLDLTTTMGKGILVFLSSLAQDERERISRREQEGREAANERREVWPKTKSGMASNFNSERTLI